MSDYVSGKSGKNDRERKKNKKFAKNEHYGSRQHIEATVCRVTSSVHNDGVKPKKEINRQYLMLSVYKKKLIYF